MRNILRIIAMLGPAVALLLPTSALAKPGHGPKPPPPSEQTVTVSGTVTTLKTNLAGDVDGINLNTGSVNWDVRFPPDQWQFIQSEAGVALGESASVTGVKRTDPEGRVHISARNVCGDTGCYTIGSLNAEPAPPPPPTLPPPPPDACEPSLLVDDGPVASLKYAPKGVHITVHDDGEGIAPEDLPHIFEPFYRGDRSRSRRRGGTGLGLAIAKAITDAHGATLTARSQHGSGAELNVTFGSTAADLEPRTSNAASTSSTPR